MSTAAEPVSASHDADATRQHNGATTTLVQEPAIEQDRAIAGQLSGGTPGEPPGEGVTKILRHPSLSHSANTAVRAIALKRAQQQYGNQFVQRAIAGNWPYQPKRSEREDMFHPKITLSEANDPEEREADRVADHVMLMADPGLIHSSPTLVQRQCAACELGGATCSKCAEEEKVRRKEGPTHHATTDSATYSQIATLRGKGQPLSQSVRDFFEPRFGYDFSGVRVHTDTTAAESAHAINALAYTSGEDIVFGAGQFTPDNATGQRLLAHELTHTIQQTGGRPLVSRSTDTAASNHAIAPDSAGPISRTSTPSIQRLPSAEDIVDSLSDALDEAESALDTVGEAASHAIDEAEDAIDWLATEAGRQAQVLAHTLGGVLSITRSGLEIHVPEFCPLDAITYDFDLGSIDSEFMVPVAGLPIGPVVLIGEIGIASHLQPQAAVQLGPICIEDVRILIDPLTGTYRISGSISATAAASLGAEIRAGLRGSLKLEGIIPIGGVPVPIVVPLIAAEGGLAGLIRGIGAGTLTVSGALSLSGGTISSVQSSRLDIGLGADLFAGAYAQLDIGGVPVCRIYWQPFEWHGDMAESIGLSMGLSITPGGVPSMTASVSPPTLSQIPFEQIPLALSREGFSDDCPIIDRLCEILHDLNLLPSQNGGVWNWDGPYGPGPLLPGPLEVYEANPGIPSGSTCRGACGPNCDTCETFPMRCFPDPDTGEVWRYLNFHDCNSHSGCREHDAAFDWAADKHGETGKWAVIMPWHMAANIECACNNLAGNCLAWIVGLPPYDMTMYFADSATQISAQGLRQDSSPVPSISELTQCQIAEAIVISDYDAALGFALDELLTFA